RNGRFSGALVGGIDLAEGGELAAETSYAKNILAILATRDGTVVYPAKPPDFSASPEWRGLISDYPNESFVHTVYLASRPVVAAARIPWGELAFAGVIGEGRLDAPAHARLRLRLAVGAGTALVPLALLVYFLRRLLRRFGAAQEAAARGARLKLLGEAANLIAHEIKNSLNGLSMGLELVTQKRPGSGRAVTPPRSEPPAPSRFT